MDVAVFETTDDLHDRVHLTDMAEELVAESFAGACAFHEPRDVHELDRGRDDLLRAGQLRQNFQSRIGHRHDAEIWVDRAEGIVRRLCFARARDRVEERRLSDVRQADDSSAQHKARRLQRERGARNRGQSSARTNSKRKLFRTTITVLPSCATTPSESGIPRVIARSAITITVPKAIPMF